MRELVRAPYMAIRAVWTRTALPRQILTNLRRTTVSPGDFLSPGLPPPPAAGYKLFFHVLPYPTCAGGPNLGMFYIHACISESLDIHARRIHVSTAGREKANRAYVRSRLLLRHRIRKCSSFDRWENDRFGHSEYGIWRKLVSRILQYTNRNSFVFV